MKAFVAASRLPRKVLVHLTPSCHLGGKSLLFPWPESPRRAAGRGGCDSVPEKAFVHPFLIHFSTSRWRLVGKGKVAVAERWKRTSDIKCCTRQLWYLVVRRKSYRKISRLSFSTVLLSPKRYWITSTGTGLIIYAHQPIGLGLPASTLTQQQQFPHHWAHLI